MQTTTQTYMVSVTTEDQMFTLYKTMPHVQQHLRVSNHRTLRSKTGRNLSILSGLKLTSFLHMKHDNFGG